jgi:hypothetical protein
MAGGGVGHGFHNCNENNCDHRWTEMRTDTNGLIQYGCDGFIADYQ